MPPKVKCPNCGQNEWLENPELGYIPRVNKLENGKYYSDLDNGIHIKVWRCNNCMYVMQFWEPD